MLVASGVIIDKHSRNVTTMVYNYTCEKLSYSNLSANVPLNF